MRGERGGGCREMADVEGCAGNLAAMSESARRDTRTARGGRREEGGEGQEGGKRRDGRRT